MPQEELAQKAYEKNLKGACYPTVQQALKAAQEAANTEDMVFVGGSTFTVAEVI